jgi:hypothetical protein
MFQILITSGIADVWIDGDGGLRSKTTVSAAAAFHSRYSYFVMDRR